MSLPDRRAVLRSGLAVAAVGAVGAVSGCTAAGRKAPGPAWSTTGSQYRPAGRGGAPGPPTGVTSVTKDAGATVSFYAPSSTGSGPLTQYVVTPYIAGVAQSATTVSVGSVGALLNSSGVTALQVPVSGLTNATAYTFTVRARNAYGDSPESAASGANTPRTGLVFGDEFNGTVLDPEWYVYSRCGYIGQAEVEWYLPSQCVLNGAGNLALTGVKTGHSGPSYPSDGNTIRNQTWISGACQSNSRSYAPAADINTMTFETRFQICPGISGGMWPGLFWLEGTDYQTAWKTDPNQATWNSTGKAEIDLAEFGSPGQSSPSVSTTSFLTNLSAGAGFVPDGGIAPGGVVDYSAAMHVFSVTWKGTSAQSTRAVKWYVDAPYAAGTGPSGGTLITSLSNRSDIPVRAYPFFMNLYLQIIAGGATSPQTCSVDYVRVYDQNLG